MIQIDLKILVGFVVPLIGLVFATGKLFQKVGGIDKRIEKTESKVAECIKKEDFTELCSERRNEYTDHLRDQNTRICSKLDAVHRRLDKQAERLEAYLKEKKSALPPSHMFNASNRAFPDVSATGHNHLLFLKGTGTRGWDLFDGTSASAPIWAAIVTRLNDARVSAGESVLGFLPPLIYLFATEVPAGFQDIPSGDNKCTIAPDNANAGSCCQYGYASRSGGWDPVTGFGTPKFDVLLEWVKTLPRRRGR